MKITKTMVISALLVLLALGGGFFAGMTYQKGKAVVRNGFYAMTQGNQGGMMRGRFGQGQGGQNFRPVRGEVLSLSQNTMTVKLPNGNSEIVVFGQSTQFVKSEAASVSDVKTGDTVMVVGTQNSDGSVTAQNVEVNPPAIGMSGTPAPTAAQ